MALKSGYLAPAIQPEGMICVKLFIPSDDLYLYALGGAYQYFTKWVAWQRGGTRAIEAAAAWQAAYDYTMANAWLNCGEDEVTTINFNPIITVSTGSGENCCNASPPPWDGTPMPGGTPNYPIPPVNPPINPIPPVMPPGTEPTEWELLRCQAANYAYDEILKWLTAIAEIPGQLVTIGAILILIWTLAPVGLLALIGVAILELASVIFSWYALSEGFDEIADFAVEWWQSKHEEMVCRFYEMTDVEITHNEVVAEFLDDLAIWADTRPWWLDSLAAMLNSIGAHLMPLQIFLAPWQLVPPVGYVGSISCPCTPQDDEEWQEHATYVWTPLVNALLVNFTMVAETPGQQNITHHILTDDGHINWGYTDAVSADMQWRVSYDAVVSAVEGGSRVAGVAWDFYYSNPDTGSPYWYETMPGGASLDVTVTTVWPKKWWIWFGHEDDTDVNAALEAISDYDGTIPEIGSDIISNGEIQSGTSHVRNGHCRVRFLVKVPS